MSGSLRMYLSNHEQSARPSAFAEATADRRSAKREGWSTSSGRAVRQFNCSPGLISVAFERPPSAGETGFLRPSQPVLEEGALDFGGGPRCDGPPERL